MNRNDIVIGGIILAVLAGGFLLLRNDTTPALNPTPTPATLGTVEEQLEDAFKVDIPDDAEKAALEGAGGSGIATRKFENNQFTATILVDLPTPSAGKFFQVWLASEDEFLALGRMSVAKGGYLLNYSVNQDRSELSNVIVSEESSVGGEPTTVVLEGNF